MKIFEILNNFGICVESWSDLLVFSGSFIAWLFCGYFLFKCYYFEFMEFLKKRKMNWRINR